MASPRLRPRVPFPRALPLLALALLVALLGGAALGPAPAAAATLVVNSGADAGGTCPGASCTLRAAIAAANPGDTITFAPAVTIVTLTSAELLVDKDLTIQGSGVGGVTIRRSAANGTPAFRILHATGGSSLTLRGLTIANGRAEPNIARFDVNGGGGVLAENSALTIVSCVVTGNTSTNGRGGGITAAADARAADARAPLALTDATVSGNTAGDPGQFSSGIGGGIFVIVVGSGGGHTASAPVTVTNSAISGNTVSGTSNANGGGLATFVATIGGDVGLTPVTLTNSTVSGNSANVPGDGGYANGGGIFVSADDIDTSSAAPLVLTNSTISGNSANASGRVGSATGGGVAVSLFGSNARPPVPVALDGATFADNTAVGAAATGHQFTLSGLAATVARSAFALPASGPAGAFFGGGGLTSLGDNVSQRDLPGAGGTDLINTDPLLGPLAANGGPTQTRLPLAGSPLLDRIPAGRCALPADQRGVARPQGAGCEPGAVELAPTLAAVRGDAAYGDPTATLTATLRLGGPGGPPLAGQLVAFTLNGTPVGSATTDAQGVATLTAPLAPGTPAGTSKDAVCATFAGGAGYAATGPACGPLVVARRLLTLKASDRTVGLRQPNPPTAPPANCVAQQTATSACWLELAPGSAFANGDDWGDLNLTNLRFTYSRNYPSSNAAETVGKTYKIAASGFSSANYDLRLVQGTLTVVP